MSTNVKNYRLLYALRALLHARAWESLKTMKAHYQIVPTRYQDMVLGSPIFDQTAKVHQQLNVIVNLTCK